ncbi:IS5 family transposase, partial [Streptomyces sp. NPDC020800]|uniref:IS5 family transposase n=1 Tax=Streptomyces sp. NPDC020800 TaxID=3365092 RepID=UPI00379B8812
GGRSHIRTLTPTPGQTPGSGGNRYTTSKDATRWQQAGVFDQVHRILLAELNSAGELDWSRACVDGSHIRAKKGGADTGPSPVDRCKTGSKHHLICDGRGTPLKVITTAANVNDVTQTLALVDGIPPVAGRPGRPRRRPEALLGDKGYDSNPNREELRKRRILPVISRKGTRTSRAWASSATSSSRPSPCSTSSNGSPCDGNAAPNSTTRSYPWPAASSAGGGSRRTDHDRVTSS